MAAKPKMTPEQWASTRATWEADPRKALPWLIQELGLPVSAEALRLRARSEGWEKGQVAEPVTKLAENPKLVKAKPKLAEFPKPKLGAEIQSIETTPNSFKGDEVLARVVNETLGRPTLYRPEYAAQAHRLCLLGATDEELGEFFGVTEQTINNWKNSFPDFFESIRLGKMSADSNVAESLYRRATGCSHPDTSINVVNGEVILTEVIKHYPPETAAAKLWLLNRQPRKWKDRVEVKEDININVFPPREVLDAVYADSMRRSTERAKVLEGRRERLGIVIENGGLHE